MLAHVESGRSPLRYALAYQIISKFTLNAGWLATGKGSSTVGFPIPSPEKLDLPISTWFSHVYETHLADDIEPKWDYLRDNLLGLTSNVKFDPNPNGRALAYSWLNQHISIWLHEVPDVGISNFVNRLNFAAIELLMEYKQTLDPSSIAKKLKKVRPAATAKRGGVNKDKKKYRRPNRSA